jgi:glycosyltransferase involved in cell wall biosynthesis
MSNSSGRRNILYYLGGFNPVGGVEVFASELIQAMPDDLAERSVAVWSGPVGQLPLLTAIRSVADRFRRTPIRWGCRWAIPDRMLLPMGLRLAADADLIVFPKLMPASIHLRLRRARGRRGGPVPSVLVIPYRPAELWPHGAEPGLLDCFDTIVAPAASFAQDLAQLGYRGRTEVINLIPPAPPAVPAGLAPRSDVLRLGYLGRLEPDKNIPYLLQIARVLAERNQPPIELHLFGDGTRRQEMEKLAAESQNLRSRVFFHGVVQGEAKWQAIDSCDLFLNTSFTEGQCIVALEVLSRGRPLAATPVGALPDILQSAEAGSLIPLNDAPAAANIVADVAARWTQGRINPAAIRDYFEARFGRKATVAAYAALFRSMMDAP